MAARGNADEAIKHYSEALRINPDYAPAHNNLGNALEAQGRVGEAKKHYSHALRLRPNYAGAHYNLANVLTGEGNLITGNSTGHEESPDFDNNGVGSRFQRPD